MLGKIYGALSIFSIGSLLAISAFVGLLFATGKLDAARLERLGAVLRDEAPDEPAEATSQPAPEQPASQPTSGRQSAQEVKDQRQQEQLRRAALERALRDVVAQRELLEQSLHELVSRQEEFEQARAAWIEQQKKLQATAMDDGFARVVELVGKMDAKKAKEYVVREWAQNRADAIRLLNALKPSKVNEILGTFKSAEEFDLMHGILEELRMQNVQVQLPSQGGPAAAQRGPNP